MTNNMPQIEEVGKSIAEDIDDINEATAFIDDLTVENRADLEVAVQMTATLKESLTEVDAKRMNWTAPLNKVVDDINATFSPAITALKNAEKKLKSKIDYCIKKNQQQRDAILEQVASASDSERNDLLARADQFVIDKIPGLSIRETTTWKVTEERAIIEYAIENGMLQLLSVDTKALKNITKDLKEKTNIPGWECSKKTTIAITASKVEK